MESLEVAEKIKAEFPDDVLEIKEFREQVGITLKRENIVAIIGHLRDNPAFGFHLLKDLSGVDYQGKKTPRFEVVYHLYSLRHNRMIRLNVQVPEDDPSVDSVTGIFKGADWHERECFDLFGITFRNHPDLRRILLPEDWEGYPLRKDYPVEGPEEREWQGYKEVLHKEKKFKKFEWKN